MAHTIESQINTVTDTLRERLSEIERQIIQPNLNDVETFLRSLDQIDAQFDELAQSDIDLRSETARWEGIQSRLYGVPTLITRSARSAGGLRALRTKYPPAEKFWWHLDEFHAASQRKMIRRTVTTLALIVLIVVGGWQLVNIFFPPDATAVFLLETTNQIEYQIEQGDLVGARTIVDDAMASKPDAPELLIWSIVLAEKLNDQARADHDIARIQELFPDQLAQVWTMLGNQRLQLGDLDGAENAANQALAVDDMDPQIYLLLASIAEVRGDVPLAISLFEKTYNLSDSNPQLQVVARYRMGQLMQQAPMLAPTTVTPD